MPQPYDPRQMLVVLDMRLAPYAGNATPEAAIMMREQILYLLNNAGMSYIEYWRPSSPPQRHPAGGMTMPSSIRRIWIPGTPVSRVAGAPARNPDADAQAVTAPTPSIHEVATRNAFRDLAQRLSSPAVAPSFRYIPQPESATYSDVFGPVRREPIHQPVPQTNLVIDDLDDLND